MFAVAMVSLAVAYELGHFNHLIFVRTFGVTP